MIWKTWLVILGEFRKTLDDDAPATPRKRSATVLVWILDTGIQTKKGTIIG